MTSFLSNIAQLKNQLDEVRAQVYPRNETEKKVYEALSSKNWGASSTLMNDIASDTYDYEKYGIIMKLIWDNIDGEGKTWKNIFKALTLVDFLIKNGSERVIEAARDKMYRIRSLQEYNYYEGNIDKGSGVREKSKQIVELLSSNESIRTEREKARTIRNKFIGISNDGGATGMGGIGFGNSRYDGGRDSGSYGGSRDTGNYGGSRDTGNYGGSRDTGGSYGGRDNGSYNGNGGGRYDGNNRYDSGALDSPYGRSDPPSFNNQSNSNSRQKFGGGAYDSDRPPRYDDEAPTTKMKDSYDDNGFGDEDQFKSKPTKGKTTSSATTSSTTSAVEKSTNKLKVNIKKIGTSSTTHTASSASTTSPSGEIDLFGGSEPDFMAAPAPVAPSKQVDLFDPFSSPVPATTAPMQSNVIDPFFSSAPVSVPSQPASQGFTNFGQSNSFSQPAPTTFDPFASAPAPIPMQQPISPMSNTGFGASTMMAPQSSFGQSNTFRASAPQPAFGSGFGAQPVMQQQPMQQPVMSTPMSPIMQSTPMQSSMYPMQNQTLAQPLIKTQPTPQFSQSYGQQQQQQQQQQSHTMSNSQQVKSTQQESDFGDFESHINANGLAKWGDVGKLVDLGSITKNEDPKMKAANSQYNYTQNSFAGLDGFSKAPQQMSAAPLGSGLRPMQPSMQQPPMGAVRQQIPVMGSNTYPVPGGGYPNQTPGFGSYPNPQYGAPTSMPGYGMQTPQYPLQGGAMGGFGAQPQGFGGYPNQQGQPFRF